MTEQATKGEPLARRVLSGDRRALARAISLVENRDPAGDTLVAELFPSTGKARVTGITGPPGVGKSTLIGSMTKLLREAGRTVGVLSVDPSSPFTRGAVLGDRIRLSDTFFDEAVFFRSLPSAEAFAGLAEAALQPAPLLAAAGREEVLLERVAGGRGG